MSRAGRIPVFLVIGATITGLLSTTATSVAPTRAYDR